MAANDWDSMKPLLYFCLTVVIVLVIFWFCLPEEDESSNEALRAPAVLPHFPYAAQGRAAAAAAPVCAICLDVLRLGQLCSEVPACRHIFHEGCIRAWAKKKNSCPLCRAIIVPGGTADNMV